MYVAPTNAKYEGSEFKLLPKDPKNPTKFQPSTSGYPAGNWFDVDTNMLWIVVKGGEAIDIRTMPVIQVIAPSYFVIVDVTNDRGLRVCNSGGFKLEKLKGKMGISLEFNARKGILSI